jgi:hypothetical protein
MYIYSFEKLEVWIETKNLSKDIYLLTNKLNALRNYQLNK